MNRVLVSCSIVLFVLACKGPTSQAGGSASDVKAPGAATGAAAAPAPSAANPKLVLDTSFGDIEIELFADKAPNGVKNFMRYVEEKLYDKTVFHRVIPGFMIQGGGFEANLNRTKTFEPLKNEADNGLKNDRGTLSWARTSDPHSATNQFYINVAANAALDHRDKSQRGWGYAVFGKVTKGMDIADKISLVPTTANGPHQNFPVDPIVIRSVKVLGK